MATPVATAEEIRTAYTALSETELLRLARYARYKTAGLERIGGDKYGADALVVEALCRALQGERKWYKEQVAFFTFFTGAMRSIANQWWRHLRTRKADFEVQYQQAHGMSEALDSFPMSGRTGRSPEEMLLHRESLEEVNRVLSLLEASFRKDEDRLALDILEGLLSGMSPPEMREALGLSLKDWETAYRRVERRAKKAAREGGYYGG